MVSSIASQHSERALKLNSRKIILIYIYIYNVTARTLKPG